MLPILMFLLPVTLSLIPLATPLGEVKMGTDYKGFKLEGLSGCVEGDGRGEDGVSYCEKLNPEDYTKIKTASEGLLVLTRRRDNDEAGHSRFMRSANVYGYNVEVIGEDGGGGNRQPILSALQEFLSNLVKEKKEDRLILYTESVDVIINAGPMALLERLQQGFKMKGVVFSADGTRWPKVEKEDPYPEVTKGRKYINTGGFIGQVGTIHKILTEEIQGPKTTDKKPEEKEEDFSLQRHITGVYLRKELRDKYNMKIDHISTIFQNLDGATGDIELRFAGTEAYIQNTLYGTVPLIIRGNGHSHMTLNTLGSYLAKAWNPTEGCRSCWEGMIKLPESPEWSTRDKEAGEVELNNGPEVQLPKVTVGIFIERATPFFSEFLTRVDELKYPKNSIDLYLHNNVEGHTKMVDSWLEEVGTNFASVKYIPPSEGLKEWHARNELVSHCLAKNCDYMFVIDAEAQLLNPFTLKLLIEQNRPVLAPMLIRPYKSWSNFWGAVTKDGFYARSMDYLEIIQSQKKGVWNVPYISECYLINASILRDEKTRPSYVRSILDPDMAFSENLREKGVFMYVSNRVEFGHLIDNEEFNLARLNPELWEVDKNRWDWERRYLNPLYTQALEPNTTNEMPCPDVFWFPVFTQRFASEMISTFEDYGRWSDGGHEDWRLEGGYESVPTIDIHMRQMGMEKEWLEILSSYIQPLQMKVFEDYNNDVGPPRAIMNFMVRYKPDEQPFLRPHHDTSTYTINVALNKPGVDYEGGGCRFLRYNCSVLDSRVGWVLMHPGRLTHLHEGLPVTKGTRYIIVSFIDP